MLNLNATGETIKLVTGSAGTIEVHASWADITGTPQVVTPGNEPNQTISTATTTTIVSAPAASTQRNIRTISIFNTHATIANTVTVKHDDGTAATIAKATLLPGDSFQHADGVWQVVPANNSIVVPGRLLQTTVLTSGTTFTTGPLTNKIAVRGVGGGAGGAGCTSVAAAASAGGGGGAGGYGEKLFDVSPNTAYTYAIGTAGAGASGAAGNNGGDGTFTVGAATLTVKGGTGAPVATATTGLNAYPGGAGGVAGSGGDVTVPGDPGDGGIQVLVATPVVASGKGGSGPFGAGGLGLVAVGNGNNATGNGAGGGGAATGASTVRTGGSGTGGLFAVDEYS